MFVMVKFCISLNISQKKKKLWLTLVIPLAQSIILFVYLDYDITNLPSGNDDKKPVTIDTGLKIELKPKHIPFT